MTKDQTNGNKRRVHPRLPAHLRWDIDRASSVEHETLDSYTRGVKRLAWLFEHWGMPVKERQE